jgi:hypothetical protein
MRRREFIAGLGSAAAWPVVARAQHPERMRRIGVLSPFTDDWDGSAQMEAFQQGLVHLGWTDGRNVRIDYRWGSGNAITFANPRWNWPRSRRTSQIQHWREMAGVAQIAPGVYAGGGPSDCQHIIQAMASSRSGRSKSSQHPRRSTAAASAHLEDMGQGAAGRRKLITHPRAKLNRA